MDEKSTASACDGWSTSRLIKEASRYRSVIDVGCGTGSILHRIKAETRIGYDVYQKALKVARKSKSDAIFRHLDLMKVIDGTFQLPVVDCIYGMDIIEHFFKDDAIELIKRCETSATKCLLFFVPVGNHPQTRDDRGFDNDYYQTHRSTWYPADMDWLGYEVWYYPNWHKNIRPPKEKGAMWCRKIK